MIAFVHVLYIDLDNTTSGEAKLLSFYCDRTLDPVCTPLKALPKCLGRPTGFLVKYIACKGLIK